MAQLRHAVENGVEPLQKGRVDHHVRDVRFAELVAENVAPIVGVDRHVDGAELDGTKPRINEGRPVGRHDRDLGAAFHPKRGEPVRDTIGHAVDVVERSRQRAELEQRPAAVTFRGGAQKPAEDQVADCGIAHGHPSLSSRDYTGVSSCSSAPTLNAYLRALTSIGRRPLAMTITGRSNFLLFGVGIAVIFSAAGTGRLRT